MNPDEWECLIEEEVIEDAIADAAEEVFNGDHSQFELAEMMDRNLIIEFQSLIGI